MKCFSLWKTPFSRRNGVGSSLHVLRPQVECYLHGHAKSPWINWWVRQFTHRKWLLIAIFRWACQSNCCDRRPNIVLLLSSDPKDKLEGKPPKTKLEDLLTSITAVYESKYQQQLQWYIRTLTRFHQKSCRSQWDSEKPKDLRFNCRVIPASQIRQSRKAWLIS